MRSAILLAFTTLLVPSPMLVPPETLDFPAVVEQAIGSWVKTNRVEVGIKTRDLIRQGFLDRQNFFLEKFKTRKLPSDEQKSLVTSIVQHYMYELRDRAKVSGKIQEVDVNGFPVSEFLKKVGPQLNGPTGELRVTSDPKEASIKIDGDNAGLTCKNFVMSVGEHDVEVEKKDKALHCNGKVMIKEGELENFSCPQNTTCP